MYLSSLNLCPTPFSTCWLWASALSDLVEDSSIHWSGRRFFLVVYIYQERTHGLPSGRLWMNTFICLPSHQISTSPLPPLWNSLCCTGCHSCLNGDHSCYLCVLNCSHLFIACLVCRSAPSWCWISHIVSLLSIQALTSFNISIVKIVVLITYLANSLVLYSSSVGSLVENSVRFICMFALYLLLWVIWLLLLLLLHEKRTDPPPPFPFFAINFWILKGLSC